VSDLGTAAKELSTEGARPASSVSIPAAPVRHTCDREQEVLVKYMLNIWGDESAWDSATPEEIQAVIDAYWAFEAEVRGAGAHIAGEALQPSAASTVVQVRGGERVLTDGPFAETKEQLGGFYLLECKDLDEAIEWAAKIPGALTGSIEVRPILEFEEPGSEDALIQEEARA
jgi:hypothetical protein